MSKISITFLALLTFLFFSIPFFSFGQTKDVFSNDQLLKIVQQLQEQIISLQNQITKLQSELGATVPETQTPSTPTIETETEKPKTDIEKEMEKQEIKIPEFTKTLFLGSRGEEVRNLQTYLAKDKEIYPEGLITGYFGPLTQMAVKKWQEKHNISAIGIVGPQTKEKFLEIKTETEKKKTETIRRLIEERAGASGVVPPGLLKAPGIKKKLEIMGTTTPVVAIPPPATTTATTTTAVATTTIATIMIQATPTATTTTEARTSQTVGETSSTQTITSTQTQTTTTQINQTATATATATTTTAATTTATTTATTADTTTPSVPTNLTAVTVSSTQINLSWTASTDNIGVIGYRIYRGGTQIATITTGTSYSDTDLSAATTYSYTIAAYDAVGNVSAQSNPVSATTLSVGLPAPTLNLAFWKFSNATANYGRLGQQIGFNYPTDTASYTNIFRLYRKQPGENTFTRVAELTGLSSTACSVGNSAPVVSGEWSMVLSGCGSFYIDRQVAGNKFFPRTDYTLGEYQFYVTAVSQSGIDGLASPISKLVLYDLVIQGPTEVQSPTASKPTFQWTASGWPCCSQGYTISISDQPSATSPLWSAYVIGTNGGSKIYDGPSLDPVKKYNVFIYGETSSGQSYYGALPYVVPQFWIGSTTTSSSMATNNLATILKSLSSVLQKLQETLKK